MYIRRVFCKVLVYNCEVRLEKIKKPTFLYLRDFKKINFLTRRDFGKLPVLERLKKYLFKKSTFSTLRVIGENLSKGLNLRSPCHRIFEKSTFIIVTTFILALRVFEKTIIKMSRL